VDRRVEEVARLLVQQFSRFEIHKAVCKKWNITWSTVDQVYIPYAKKLIQKQTNMSLSEAKEFSISLLLDAARVGSVKDKINVAQTIARIFGFFAPVQLEHSGRDGAPIEIEAQPLKDVAPSRLRELAALVVTHGDPNGN